MSTQFVEMYHPNIPATAVTPALVAIQAVDEQYARGWLLVDPAAPPPVVNTPYYTREASDSRYVRDWAGAETVTAGAIRVAPDGHVIVRTANGSTRSSYDATEQAAWTAVGGGGAVSSVVGQTGAVTGAQIAADVALRAALVSPIPTVGSYTYNSDGTIATDPDGNTYTWNADGTPATQAKGGVTRTFHWATDGTLASVS